MESDDLTQNIQNALSGLSEMSEEFKSVLLQYAPALVKVWLDIESECKKLNPEYTITNTPEDKLIKITRRVLRRYKREGAEVKKKERDKTLAQVSSNVSQFLDTTIGKETQIWNYLTPQDSNTGQIRLIFETSGEVKEAALKLALTFDFEALKNDPEYKFRLTKQLSPFDKRVMEAADSLGKDGKLFSATLVNEQMGGVKRPSGAHLKKINLSLEKMRNTVLYVDNSKEIEAGVKYPPFRYDGSLLPFERITTVINNKKVDIIRLLKEPPLMQFARGRKHITQIPLKVLQTPLSKTDNNIQLENFFLAYIQRMKHQHKKEFKLLFSTIYKACSTQDKIAPAITAGGEPIERGDTNVKERKRRQRLREDLPRLLDHYQETHFISSYKISTNSVSITLYEQE